MNNLMSPLAIPLENFMKTSEEINQPQSPSLSNSQLDFFNAGAFNLPNFSNPTPAATEDVLVPTFATSPSVPLLYTSRLHDEAMPEKNGNNCPNQACLPEIRDTLQEIKQLMQTMLGSMKEVANNTAMLNESLSRQNNNIACQCNGNIDYYNLSPKTINKIEGLSLDELLLCVAPSKDPPL